MAKVDLATLNKVKAEASQQMTKTEKPANVNKTKGGRPKKEVTADQRVVLLLTKDEMTKYQEFCADNGTTQSGFLRLMLKEKKAI